jgi:xanthine dehydrogenase YagR molybdenum-binding subunit
LEELLGKAAPHLEATARDLEVGLGKIQVKDNPVRSLTWKQACAKLGMTSIRTVGKQPDPQKGRLASGGVGGVQMADVSVDIETGVVKMNKFVAVQDCGLIIDLTTAESQVYGAVIQGICYALTEECIHDPTTGRRLNPDMEFYKLAGIGDIGEIVVHMMQGKQVMQSPDGRQIEVDYDAKGVVGLGEPPVISPGAAISNAVANALGVRVPHIPLTPDRVLAALDKKGGVA